MGTNPKYEHFTEKIKPQNLSGKRFKKINFIHKIYNRKRNELEIADINECTSGRKFNKNSSVQDIKKIVSLLDILLSILILRFHFFEKSFALEIVLEYNIFG